MSFHKTKHEIMRYKSVMTLKDTIMGHNYDIKCFYIFYNDFEFEFEFLNSFLILTFYLIILTSKVKIMR